MCHMTWKTKKQKSLTKNSNNNIKSKVCSAKVENNKIKFQKTKTKHSVINVQKNENGNTSYCKERYHMTVSVSLKTICILFFL